jgi:hypothetical protein
MELSDCATVIERARDLSQASNPWPKRLRTHAALDYLEVVHGIVVAEKTLRNKRSEGSGPRWQYLGSTPYVTTDELDRWVEATLSDQPAHPRRKYVASSGEEDLEAA